MSSTVSGAPAATKPPADFVARVHSISRQSSVFLFGTLFTVAAGYVFKIYLARVLGAEVVPDYSQIRCTFPSVPKRGRTMSLRNVSTTSPVLFGLGKADGLSGSEFGEELNGRPFVVSVPVPRRLPPPALAATRNGGQWSHFVDTDHDAVCRWIAVQAYDLVFFESKSGS